MNADERLNEIAWRTRELSKQLTERAKLYRLMGATEIGDEFQRLQDVELEPILKLAVGDDSACRAALGSPTEPEREKP